MNRSISVWLVLLLLLPAVAHAQSPDASFDDIAQRLKHSQSVIVTDVNGQNIEGTLAGASDMSITLRVRDGLGERTRTIARSDVHTIRKTDSIWNGLLIGLGAGFLATEVWVHRLCGPRGSDDECAAIVSGVGWLTVAPGGAAVGALIDKFSGNQVIYRRTGARTTLRVAPALGPARQGVLVSVGF